uniref:Uncharacterized protein n=1 Tax=Setaria digitata TaxID=48799 RepID=A0A915PLU7_9BILA
MNAGKMNDNVVRTTERSNTDSGKAETGAFRPVTRRRHLQNESNQVGEISSRKFLLFDQLRCSGSEDHVEK